MFRLIRTFILLITVAAPAAAAVEATIINLPSRGALNLALSPAGKADVERLATLSRVRVDIERIPLPATLAPAMNVYVVWAISPEGAAENIGELSIVEGRGRIETVTRLDRLGLIITAEPHYMVDMPSSYVAYVSQAPRETAIRRTTLQVETGRYSYNNLKPAARTAANMTIAIEARAALDIARAANADRVAEAEFRLARVALETMEAMLARSNPPEVVIPAAHDTIRHAARATTKAREYAAGKDSGFIFDDRFIEKPSGSLTAAGTDAVERIAAALSLWSGPLRVRCSAATMAAARAALTKAGIPENRLVFVALP